MATINLTSRNDTFRDTNASNTINAFAGDDNVSGNGGNDQIYGGAGVDRLFGGLGNDRLYDPLGNEVGLFNRLTGNEGDDLISARADGSNGALDALGNEGNDIIAVGTGEVEAAGGSGDDLIDVSAVISTVSGDDGADTIQIVGRAGETGHTARGGNGADLIVADSINTELYGDADDDTLDLTQVAAGEAYGGTGRDVLLGTDRDSTSLLDGGPGTDLLIGGLGEIDEGGLEPEVPLASDTFDFNEGDTGTGLAADRIRDFDFTLDLIDVAGIDARLGTTGDQAFTFIGDDPFTGAGQLRVVDVGRGSLVQATTDGDAESEAEIALVNTTGLAADDFVL